MTRGRLPPTPRPPGSPAVRFCPSPSVGTSFRLAQISDSHIGASWAGGDPAAGLAATIEEVGRRPARPEGVLIPGDLADNAAAANYEVLRRLFTRTDAPPYVLGGTTTTGTPCAGA